MIRYGLLASTLLFGAFLSGCTAECTSSRDCESTEICYRELCTPATADYITCAGDDDCNEFGGTAFTCRGGYCRLEGGLVPPMDASVVDTGMMMTPDAGTSTTTDAGN